MQFDWGWALRIRNVSQVFTDGFIGSQRANDRNAEDRPEEKTKAAEHLLPFIDCQVLAVLHAHSRVGADFIGFQLLVVQDSLDRIG